MQIADQFLIIFDLEATCWRGRPPIQNEIIEIGALAFRQTEGILDEFQAFVRPKLSPELSSFCKSLTSISQLEVDSAMTFPAVWEGFLDWRLRFEPIILASWGDYDRRQLLLDGELHGLDLCIERHINLKRLFAKIVDCQPCGLTQGLERLGMTFEGTHHRGIDDARNICRLMRALDTDALFKYLPKFINAHERIGSGSGGGHD